MADPVRRALSIAVGSFADAERELTYAPELADDLRTVLIDLGYESLSPPADLSSESLGGAITAAIEECGPDDVLLVHLITHAEKSDDTEKVYALGPDEMRHRLARIDEWVASVQDEPGRPLTLFLLDVCYAGNVARLPWQSRVADGSGRAWVIGACAPDRAAFDGRLTQAIVNVVAALRRGELDLDAALPYAPFVTVARAIGQEVKRLTEESGGLPQEATGSLLDITAIPPDLPFFPNPAYPPPTLTQRVRADVGAMLAPFLEDVDEALDVAHFFERAAGGPQVTRGCFSGRRDELRELVPWMQGYGKGSLRVVTGSPGVGKSALLGILVCSAHRRLRKATAGVWQQVDNIPPVVEPLAAVHARKRGRAEIESSLAGQLELDTGDLVTGVLTLDPAPLIVVDALDEADRPDEVMNDLLLPLARAVRGDGSAACRLLVGTRRWGLDPLIDEARADEGLIDLDEVDRNVLYDEIETYVLELLRANPAYRRLGAVRGAFASAVAGVISAPPDPGEERWGEFLVAGLYTRHFISGATVTDADRAAELGERVPRTLPEVFALDLSTGSAEARLLLTALAHAQGEGMPMAAAVRAATGMRPAAADRARWGAALDEGRFYLRRATDVDGTTIYRIFHEGLAEHLRAASRPDLIYQALVAPLNGERGRRWDLAEPYLLRHAPAHADAAGEAQLAGLADDAEFLVHGDASALAAIARLRPTAAAFVDEIRLLGAPGARRRFLALAAARSGYRDLAARLSVSSDGTALSWRPVWADRRPAGSGASARVRLAGRLTGHSGAVNTAAVGRIDGRAVVVTGGADATVRLWDLAGLGPLDELPFPGPVHVVTIGEHLGEPVLLACGTDSPLALADLRRRMFLPMTSSGDITRALASGHTAGELVAVTGDMDGGEHLWSSTTARGSGRVLLQRQTFGRIGEPIEAAALGRRADGTAYAVIGSRDGRIEIHSLIDHQARLLDVPGGPVYAIATGELDGRSVIITGGTGDRGLTVWDEARCYLVASLSGHVGTVFEADAGRLGDRAIAVTGGGDGTVRFWDLRAATEFTAARAEHASPVYAVALGESDHGETVAVTGAKDGSVLVWNITETVRPTLIGTYDADDGPAALLNGDPGTVLVRHLRTGNVHDELDVGEDNHPSGLHHTVLAGRPVPVLFFEDGGRALLDDHSADRLIRVSADSPFARSLPAAPASAAFIDGEALIDVETPLTAASRLADRTVVYSGAGATVTVSDTAGRTLDTVEVPGEITALCAHPRGYLLVETTEEVICFAHSSVPA